MSTEAKRKWEVGQTLWWEQTARWGDRSQELVIAKVGRKWLTVWTVGEHSHEFGRVDAETLQYDMNSTPPGQVWTSREECETRRALEAAWRSLREAIGYSPPPTATVEGVHKAAAILGLTLEGGKK